MCVCWVRLFTDLESSIIISVHLHSALVSTSQSPRFRHTSGEHSRRPFSKTRCATEAHMRSGLPLRLGQWSLCWTGRSKTAGLTATIKSQGEREREREREGGGGGT